MATIAETVKNLRKTYNLTQEELALRAGVGLCLVRNLEQGIGSQRVDKVNQLLNLFDYELVAERKQHEKC